MYLEAFHASRWVIHRSALVFLSRREVGLPGSAWRLLRCQQYRTISPGSTQKRPHFLQYTLERRHARCRRTRRKKAPNQGTRTGTFSQKIFNLTKWTTSLFQVAHGLIVTNFECAPLKKTIWIVRTLILHVPYWSCPERLQREGFTVACLSCVSLILFYLDSFTTPRRPDMKFQSV